MIKNANNINSIKMIIIDIFLFMYIFIILCFFDELFVYMWVLFFVPLVIIPITYIYMFVKSIILIKQEVNNYLNWISLFILILIVIMWIFFNPSNLRNKYEFRKYSDDRSYIINQVKKDKSKFKEKSKIKLEEKYEKLSRDGEITIFLNNEKESLIGFTISAGIPDEKTYLVYSSSGEKIIKDNIKLITEIEKIDKYWYYVQLK